MERLEPDGSRDVAEGWVDTLLKAGEIDELLRNKAFARVVESIRFDARQRLAELIKSDPELVAMQKLLVRTVGRQRQAEIVEKTIEEFLTTHETEERRAG